MKYDSVFSCFRSLLFSLYFSIVTIKSEHKLWKEERIGHKKIRASGEILYKDVESTLIMACIQRALKQLQQPPSISSPEEHSNTSNYDLEELLFSEDRLKTKQVHFSTSSDDSSVFHSEVDFRFKTYAPPAFDHFRVYLESARKTFWYNIKILLILTLYVALHFENCLHQEQAEACFTFPKMTSSSSKLFKKERRLLLQVLEDYYQNLKQNPRTLLPKFFGLYNYIPKTGGNKNIRFVGDEQRIAKCSKDGLEVRPQRKHLQQKSFVSRENEAISNFQRFGLCGAFFLEGSLEEATYNALMRTLERDANVLESLKIMDYSLLIGIHSLDLAASENSRQMQTKRGGKDLEESKIQKRNRRKLVAHSTALESIEIELDDMDFEVPFGGIPAKSRNGIIFSFSWSYRLSKKLEHTWKAVVYDGNTVSVHRPEFYARRFMDFLKSSVFCDRSRCMFHLKSKYFSKLAN
ncbi:Phosphatidylinositol 4-phosphate 5-kinase type-1 alpha, partial [Orchesella cincta]